MSPDWPWLVVLALVIPPALGHLYHFVLLVNCRQRSGLPRAADGPNAKADLRRAPGLFGFFALDASAQTVVELGVAALELCRSVRGLGHHDLAAQLMADYPAAPSRGYRWVGCNSRPGPASRDDPFDRSGSRFLAPDACRATSHFSCNYASGTSRSPTCRRSSMACKLSSSAISTLLVAMTAGFLKRWSMHAWAGTPTWLS